MPGPYTQLDQAYAVVRVATDGTSNGTTDPDSYREGRATATARTGAGVYTVTLDPGVDAAEVEITARIYGGAAGANIHVNQTTDTNIAVTTFNAAGAATDQTWGLTVRKVRSAT